MRYVFTPALMLLVFGLFFATPTREAYMAREMQSPEYWKSAVHRDPVVAYEQMADALTGLDPNMAHGIAHAFGQALFEAHGLERMDVCDERFIYGCLHEFLGQTLAHEGLEVLDRVYAACAAEAQCEHAIGHGLIGFFGYEDAHLKEAVDVCSRHTSVSFFSGCGSGIFMEYFLPSMTGTTSPGSNVAMSRPVGETCDRFEGEVASTCYFWYVQGIWETWDREQPLANLQAAVRALCGNLTDMPRAYCFAAAGQMAVSATAYDMDRISALCDGISDHEGEKTLCYTYAARALAGAVSKEKGDAMCTKGEAGIAAVCAQNVHSAATPGEFHI